MASRPAKRDRTAQLVAQAESLRTKGDFRRAVELLRDGLSQGIDTPHIRFLLAQTQRLCRQQEEHLAWLDLVDRTRTRMEVLAASGALNEALALLSQTELQHGVMDEVRTLRIRLEELRRLRERAELPRHLIEARRLHAAGALEEAMRETRRAIALDPHGCEARDLMDSLEVERDKRDRMAVAAVLLGRIGDLMQRGHLIRAELALLQARRAHPDHPDLQSLYLRCRRLRSTRWARSWNSLRGTGSSVLIGQRKWLAMAATGLVLILSVGARLLNVEAIESPEPVPSRNLPTLARIAPVEPVLPIPEAPPGDLILDALPWGRILSVVDLDGQSFDPGEDAYTPIRLTLPAGSYRVRMENPAVDGPVEIRVQIDAAGVTRKVHAFAPCDADTYLERGRL